MTKNLIRKKKNTTSQQVDKKYCSARTMNEGFKKKMNQQEDFQILLRFHQAQAVMYSRKQFQLLKFKIYE